MIDLWKIREWEWYLVNMCRIGRVIILSYATRTVAHLHSWNTCHSFKYLIYLNFYYYINHSIQYPRATLWFDLWDLFQSLKSIGDSVTVFWIIFIEYMICLFYRKIEGRKVPVKKKMMKNPKPVEPIGQRILVHQIVRVNRSQIRKQRYYGHLSKYFKHN